MVINLRILCILFLIAGRRSLFALKLLLLSGTECKHAHFDSSLTNRVAVSFFLVFRPSILSPATESLPIALPSCPLHQPSSE